MKFTEPVIYLCDGMRNSVILRPPGGLWLATPVRFEQKRTLLRCRSHIRRMGQSVRNVLNTALATSAKRAITAANRTKVSASAKAE